MIEMQNERINNFLLLVQLVGLLQICLTCGFEPRRFRKIWQESQ